jgi:hypothetical protein
MSVATVPGWLYLLDSSSLIYSSQTWVMPGMNGIETAIIIESFGRTPSASLPRVFDASVSQFLSYLGEQVEAATPGSVPAEWTKDEAPAAK